MEKFLFSRHTQSNTATFSSKQKITENENSTTLYQRQKILRVSGSYNGDNFGNITVRIHHLKLSGQKRFHNWMYVHLHSTFAIHSLKDQIPPKNIQEGHSTPNPFDNKTKTNYKTLTKQPNKWPVRQLHSLHWLEPFEKLLSNFTFSFRWQ